MSRRPHRPVAIENALRVVAQPDPRDIKLQRIIAWRVLTDHFRRLRAAGQPEAAA